MSWLQLACYAGIGFFGVAVAAKVIRIARMPIHLRWDLYPIPHEKGKAAYGGSYFEEIDWWTKPRQFSLVTELHTMAVEILFLQSLYHHNRRLWYLSFPFHIGLYSLVGFAALLVIGGVLQAAGESVAAGSPEWYVGGIYYLTIVLGTAGWTLTALGSFGLLLFRSLNSEIRRASVRSDYFNLVFLLAVSAAGFSAWVTVDQDYEHLRALTQGLIMFQPVAVLPGAVAAQAWITVALLFYFPFTHMTHMFGKYFTYHKVRWEDHPNIRGSKIEEAVTDALGYPLTWAAPHIRKGSWAEAAADGVKQSGE